MLPRLSAYSTEGWLRNFHFSKLLSYENAHDCYPTSKPLFQQSYLVSYSWADENLQILSLNTAILVKFRRELLNSPLEICNSRRDENYFSPLTTRIAQFSVTLERMRELLFSGEQRRQ